MLPNLFFPSHCSNTKYSPAPPMSYAIVTHVVFRTSMTHMLPNSFSPSHWSNTKYCPPPLTVTEPDALVDADHVCPFTPPLTGSPPLEEAFPILALSK